MSVRRAIADADLSTLNVAAFCRGHGISRDRFYDIRRRYEAEGEAGLESRSRAPHTVANRTPSDVEDAIVRLRKDLIDLGVEAGAATIGFHLPTRLGPGVEVPSDSTIWRVLTRRGFIVADPSKKPKRSGRSFSAERANECWQIDDTEWFLADGTSVKIIDIIDDCSRVCIASVVVKACTGAEAFNAMATGATEWGWPERFLSDNAKAFKYTLAAAVAELGIGAGHSRPYHPQTNGKVERFHQTLKKFLTTQPLADDIAGLQAQVDWFRRYYNQERPHRSLGRTIPGVVWAATPRSGPADHPITGPTKIYSVIVSNGIANHTRKFRVSIGAAYNHQRATTVITGTTAHVFVDGRLVRTLTIDPTRSLQTLHDRPGRSAATR